MVELDTFVNLYSLFLIISQMIVLLSISYLYY